MARIETATAQSLERAAELIRAGELVAYPTETCYGLGGDALARDALDSILQAKGRPSHQPISVLVSDHRMLRRVVASVTPQVERLMERYWPGPLTLVLPAAAGLPRPLLNAAGGVGVRMSSDPVARALVAAVGGPLTATSANRSGESPAIRAAAAAALEDVSLVIDDGVRDAAPSTVVAVDGTTLRVIRPGPITIERVGGATPGGGPGDRSP